MNHLLENKIKEHAAEIFGSEPIKGHRDRFADKLQTAGGKKQIPVRNIIVYLSVAAVFAGIILFSRYILNPAFEVESEPLYEVYNYYDMQLQDKIYKIEQLLPQVDENDRARLLEDIVNLQKDAVSSIQNSDEKNIAFIVKTYSSKIESLQHIYNILTTNLLII